MRIGADRIVKCIMGIVNGYGLPEVMPWISVAQQLGDERGRITEVELPAFDDPEEMLPLVSSRTTSTKGIEMPKTHAQITKMGRLFMAPACAGSDHAKSGCTLSTQTCSW